MVSAIGRFDFRGSRINPAAFPAAIQWMRMRTRYSAIYEMSTPADCIRCALCSFRTVTVSEWVSHLRLVHCNDSDFKIVCGINGCAKTYQKCSSFLSHVYRSHRQSIIQAKKQRHLILCSVVLVFKQMFQMNMILS